MRDPDTSKGWTAVCVYQGRLLSNRRAVCSLPRVLSLVCTVVQCCAVQC